MKLTHKLTKQSIEAEISLTTNEDISKIMEDDGFTFDWSTEKQYELYKLYTISNKEQILGLMSLIDLRNDYRIHLNLLEIRVDQQGKNKQLDHITGCLIAYAASEAIKRGYYGFVSLEPKIQLINHYQQKYGFKRYGRYLAIDGQISQTLVHKYLNNE